MGEFYRCFFAKEKRSAWAVSIGKCCLLAIGMILFSVMAYQSYAQSITNLSLNAAYACATSNFNSYQASYQVQGVFGNTNQFVLELSDINGNFNANTTVLQTISAIDDHQDISFSFPEIGESYGGDQFKIRLRATNPVAYSPVIGPYEYHWFKTATADPFVLNDFQPVEVCTGNSAVISVSQTNHAAYKWFRNGNEISGETGSSLTVTQAGNYQAWVDLGSCTENGNIFEAISNQITVSVLQNFEVSIQASGPVELCPGESYSLAPDVINPAYYYTWYKDGQAVQGPSHTPTYSVDSPDKAGLYKVEMENASGSCIAVSQVVSVSYKGALDLEMAGDLKRALLPGKELQLQVNTSTSNPQITWYKDNGLLPGEHQLSLQVTAPGNYFARLTQQLGSCGSVSIDTELVQVLEPLSFEVQVAPENGYVSCEKEEVALTLTSLQGIAADGTPVVLTTNDYQDLDFQWYKAGVELVSSSAEEFTLNSAADNGNYSLEVNYQDITGVSNSVQALVSLPELSITSSGLILCEEEAAVLQAPLHEEYAYQWYKNGELIEGATDASFSTNLAGEYYCVIDAFACSQSTESIRLLDFNPELVKLHPSGTIRIPQGGQELITASGALEYKWYDESGALLSEEDRLSVSKEGRYTLEAFVVNCMTTRTVEVEMIKSASVPELISINGDGINDTWVIPETYAFQKDVEIGIIGPDGEPALQTKNYQNNWPDQDKVQANQVYHYYIKTSEKLIQKGSISIIK